VQSKRQEQEQDKKKSEPDPTPARENGGYDGKTTSQDDWHAPNQVTVHKAQQEGKKKRNDHRIFPLGW
jgi:hypothetical protein